MSKIGGFTLLDFKTFNINLHTVKRREAKSKGEKERYKHLNAEFQRIARRDKKDNRQERLEISSIFRDTKGIFHAKMGLIKDRNGMDLTEAEDIKNICGKNTQNYTKKIFMTQIIIMV